MMEEDRGLLYHRAHQLGPYSKGFWLEIYGR